MNRELKPCPFCGGKDIRRVITTSYCEIECDYCKVKIGRGLFCGRYDSLAEAENDFGKETDKAWNRRATE